MDLPADLCSHRDQRLCRAIVYVFALSRLWLVVAAILIPTGIIYFLGEQE
ncbi:hypothetical protein ACQP1O_19080 [Nocardia sp. CA-151230]